MKKHSFHYFSTILTLFIFIILIIILIGGIKVKTVSGSSMLPIFNDGDKILIWGFAYGIPYIHKKGYIVCWNKPRPNDIIVFRFDKKDPLMIKRVKAIEGDFIFIKNRKLEISNSTIALNKQGEQILSGITEIPLNKQLVIGDNIFDSVDSRNFGLINISDIEGKVLIGKKGTYYENREL